jgi:hypothetical protein
MTPTVPRSSMAVSTTSLMMSSSPAGAAPVIDPFRLSSCTGLPARMNPTTANAIISIGNSDSTLK